MKTVNAEIKIEKKPSRVELFIRFVWGFICAVVLYLFSIIAGLCWVVQWLYILVLGKRMDALDPWIQKVVKGQFKLQSYMALQTDERPPLVPED